MVIVVQKLLVRCQFITTAIILMESASCIGIEDDGDDECSASTSGSVWKYFNKKSSQESVQCQLCNAAIKCKGSSTSGLIRHLRAKHNITFNKQWLDKVC